MATGTGTAKIPWLVTKNTSDIFQGAFVRVKLRVFEAEKVSSLVVVLVKSYSSYIMSFCVCASEMKWYSFNLLL